MAYNFTGLSSADFEDLVLELIGSELGLRFEAFAAGPDGGIDGRHASCSNKTILQAKHFVGSTFQALRSAMKRERPSIDRLAPTRYLLATSRPLTPSNKKVLAAEIGRWLKTEADIFGPDDLNALLRKFPDVEKSHIKLWLSSTAVLEKLVHSAAHTFNSITHQEIETKVRVYASNPSFSESRSILEAQHVLIISGPPGVGKTTLAEMLSYAYLSEGWDLVAIRSLDDGFSAIVDTRKQVFLFDDFLGKIALDTHALAAKDSDLARFMKRIRGSRNARFILATRAYIFEEARRISEHLADKRFDISKYVLDVGVYTRRIRARILYNHLLVAGTPQPYVQALIESGKLPAIVDHKNYNPRVVEWMTDGLHLSDVLAEHYPDQFLDALANPHRLWDIAFRTHILEKCRHLLLALFFCSEYGAEVNDLRLVFNALHEHLSQKYGHPRDPKDFEEAIRILEGGFVTVRNTSVAYINPSLRDYMQIYISDFGLLSELALTAQKADWAAGVWKAANSLAIDRRQRCELASRFKGIAVRLDQLPIWKRANPKEDSYRIYDSSNAERIVLLLAWWEASGDGCFADCAVRVAKNPINIGSWRSFSPWLDGRKLVKLASILRDDENYPGLPVRHELLEAIEQGLCKMLEAGMSADDLVSLSDAIDLAGTSISSAVHMAAREAIRQEFEHVRYSVEVIDSESALNDHITALETLAPRVAIGAAELANAVATVKVRISELNEEATVVDPPSFTGPQRAPDIFEDVDLQNLFLPLLQRS